MNKLLRQLLSGGSFAALQLCALGGGAARAAGTTISNNRTNVVIAAPEDYILVSPTGHITGNLTNNATVGVHSFGIEVQTGAGIGGSIINSAAGIINASRTGIAIQSGADLVGGINNAGKINVLATHTSGTARGIDYLQTGGQAMNLTNSGTIKVSATGSHTNSSLTDIAHGIRERDVNAHAGTPTLTLSNTGAVTLNAAAKVTGTVGSTRAVADARTAIEQTAANVRSATLNLTNSAALHLQATGKAISTSGRGLAFASAKRALVQIASASTIVAGNVITETLANTGALSLAANATGTAGGLPGGSTALAHATVGSAVLQDARRASDMEMSLTNSGQLSLEASGKAKELGHSSASASGIVRGVLVQSAENGTTSAALVRKANLTLTNSGSVSLVAQAVASGTQASAQARITGFALQFMDRGGVVNEKLTNTNTGALSLVAHATALGTANSATASARVSRALYQFASDASVLAADSSITQTLTNNASMVLTATAKSTIEDAFNKSATGKATVVNVIFQDATHNIIAAQSLTNSGALTANAKATALAANLHATGIEYRAIARAKLTQVFAQIDGGTASTTRQTGSKATQTISNSGALTLTAAANGRANAGTAGGTFQFGSAAALVSAVFYQKADAAAITQSISNSGVLHLNATALGKFTGTATGKAFANARVENVFEQSASGLTTGATISQSISNTGNLSLGAMATAVLNGASRGHIGVSARVLDIFHQTASHAKTVAQTITNSGALAVAVVAKGTDQARGTFSGNDRIKASIEDVFLQDPSNAASSVTQSITNSGALTLSASASGKRGVAAQTGAFGSEVVRAIVQDVFDQIAEKSITIAQSIANSGAIVINESAAATAIGSAHKAHGHATAAELFYQFASASGIAPSSATQSITNTASIGLTLSAKGKAQNATANSLAASASAKARHLFVQSVDESLNATQSITNSGAFTFKANATATGVGHTAYARVTAGLSVLFQQSYSANSSNVRGGTVNQTLSNSGALSLTIVANANGQAKATTTHQGAQAVAKASNLFSQAANLSSQNAGTLNQTISNTGSITLSESASSTTTGKKDYAESEAFRMFEQRANDAGNATQTITSGGAIAATLAATAKGATSSADASAYVGSIIDQFVGSSDKATQNATISNTGSITISATATAVSATAGKRAFAEVGNSDDEFFQGASSISGAVAQNFTSNAPIKLTLGAIATGVTRATVRAELSRTFLLQNVSNAFGSVSQNLTNNGALTISLSGKAKGKNIASAQVSIGSKLWEQRIDNGGKPASQSITNSASVSLAVVAVATATRARAKATLDSELVYQTARANNLGTLTQSISNSGAFSIAQTALANGKTHADVSAGQSDIFRQEGQAYADVSQNFTNSGNFSLTASAKALAAAGAVENTAEADLAAFVYQSAFSNLVTTAAGIFVNQTITNSGSISLKNAATATGAARVYASAEGHVFFKQFDRSGSAVTQKINNSGALTVSFTAKGKSSGAHSATAVAGLGKMLAQTVDQTGHAGQVANLSITNSGNITFGAAATATAAGAPTAFAEAYLGAVFSQNDSNSVSANLSVTNSATIAVSNVAKANGKGDARATGSALFASQQVFERTQQNFTNAVLSLTNSGKVTLGMAVTAVATNSARATGRVSGVWQELEVENNKSSAPSGSLSISNSGTISLTATAKATAGNRVRAFASAIGARQSVRQSGFDAGLPTSTLGGSVSFSNSGTISVNANATVAAATPHVALTGTTAPQVYARATGAAVYLEGQSLTAVSNTEMRKLHDPIAASVSLSNSGSMSVAAVAVGAGVDHAKATVTAMGMRVEARSLLVEQGATTHAAGTFEHSTKQFGGVPVHGAISNSGTLSVSGTATGGTVLAGGIQVTGSVHTESITNAFGGSINVTASGATAAAGGFALNNLLDRRQSATHRNSGGAFTSRNDSTSRTLFTPATNITGAVTNSGSMTVSATGTVQEEADGIAVNAVKVSNTILNTGVMSITASGPAAVANGIHLFQSNLGVTATEFFRNPVVGANANGGVTHHVQTRLGQVAFAGVLNNTGTITVTANASTGVGSANGIDVEGGNLAGGSVLNSGTINSIANGPTAIANGVLLSGGGAVGFSNRSGTINATATSSSGASLANGVFLADNTLTGTTLTGGSGTVTANGATGATANGWLIQGAGKLVMVGSGGVLNVNATGTKSNAVANGINVQGGALTGSTITNSDTIKTQATAPVGTTTVANSILVVGTGALTVANAGGTLSSLVTLGGATSYSNAINVNGASAAAITLSGGTIAGNILEASGGNAITVSSGNTLFNGAINPSKALLGSVTVASGGTLTLGSNGGLGAGNVWTGSFTQAGTLALNATTDTTLEGTVHATTASLSGPAVLNINLAGAAFGATTTYKVVFTTGALSGTWSSVTAPDPTFFTAAGVYTANEADITLTRASLGSIAGLTPNEQAIGNALETIYEAGGATGPLGSLTSALFALTPTQYADALQQLSGETVGDLAATDAADLQSFMDTIIDHLGDGTGGTASGSALNGASGLPGVHPAQISDGPVSAWGGFIASGAQVAATVSGPAYHTHENGVMAGVDFAVDANAMLGIALGYNNGGLRTTSDQGSFNVIQVSGYGRYEDPDNQWYALGDVGYGGFRNTLHRTIAIPGLATSTVTGKFDSSTVSLYGEAGYHLDSSIKLTPYAAISYLNADADPFTETGSFVAPLSVAKSGSNSTLSYLGAWFSQTWMSDNLAITPSIKAAWEHDFSANAWTMTSTFAPVSTAGFSINGSGLSRDAAFIDAGVSVNGGDNVDFKLSYQGRLSSDRTESAIVGRIVFKF